MRTPASEVRPFDRVIENVCTEAERSTTRTDYEVSLLRLFERLTNGTVIEISLTGALKPTRYLVLWLTAFYLRHRDSTQTWDHCWGSTHPRVPTVTLNRLFPGTCHYGSPVFEKASRPHAERRHHG